MKAMIYTKYGPPDVLKLAKVEKPIPSDDEVLVNVRAASVNYSNTAFVAASRLSSACWAVDYSSRHSGYSAPTSPDKWQRLASM